MGAVAKWLKALLSGLHPTLTPGLYNLSKKLHLVDIVALKTKNDYLQISLTSLLSKRRRRHLKNRLVLSLSVLEQVLLVLTRTTQPEWIPKVLYKGRYLIHLKIFGNVKIQAGPRNQNLIRCHLNLCRISKLDVFQRSPTNFYFDDLKTQKQLAVLLNL